MSVNPQTVGIISDTGNISDRDNQFWGQLRQEFDKRNVSVVIIDGGFLPQDIGRKEFNGLLVYYSPFSDQPVYNGCPDNWIPILDANPVVDIAGHRFLVQHNMGGDIHGKTEVEMIHIARKQSCRFQHIDFIICGGIHDALYEEGSGEKIINPGDARVDRKFVTICFPRNEVTFSSVGFGTNRI